MSSATTLGMSVFFSQWLLFTWFQHVYFLKYKEGVLDRFMKYERMLANEFRQLIKMLRADNSGEYCSRKFRKYLGVRGLKM